MLLPYLTSSTSSMDVPVCEVWSARLGGVLRLPLYALDSKICLETSMKLKLLLQTPLMLTPWFPLAYIEGRYNG